MTEVDKNGIIPMKSKNDELSNDLHKISKINSKFKNITAKIKELIEI
jgi:hypothetical protein